MLIPSWHIWLPNGSQNIPSIEKQKEKEKTVLLHTSPTPNVCLLMFAQGSLIHSMANWKPTMFEQISVNTRKFHHWRFTLIAINFDRYDHMCISSIYSFSLSAFSFGCCTFDDEWLFRIINFVKESDGNECEIWLWRWEQTKWCKNSLNIMKISWCYRSENTVFLIFIECRRHISWKMCWRMC